MPCDIPLFVQHFVILFWGAHLVFTRRDSPVSAPHLSVPVSGSIELGELKSKHKLNLRATKDPAYSDLPLEEISTSYAPSKLDESLVCSLTLAVSTFFVYACSCSVLLFFTD